MEHWRRRDREKGSVTWLEWLLPINKNPWRKKNYPHHYSRSWLDLSYYLCWCLLCVYIPLNFLKSTKIFIIFLTHPTTQSHSSSLTRLVREREKKYIPPKIKKNSFLYILHMFYLFMNCNEEGGSVCEFWVIFAIAFDGA